MIVQNGFKTCARTPQPLRINNPKSQHFIVRLKPEQSMIVFIGEEGQGVEIQSPYLRLDVCGFEYTVIVDEFCRGWSRFSTCYIGEVWVHYKDETSAKILVYLDSENESRKDVICVVNPDFWDVRLKPYDILETILYEPAFEGRDEWTWQWTPLEGVDLECIGFTSITPSVWENYADIIHIDPNDIYSPAPRFPIQNTQPLGCRQHHFWFRFSESIMGLLPKGGVVPLGPLTLEGSDGIHGALYYNLMMYVDCNQRYRLRTMQTLDLKKQHDAYQARKSVDIAESVVSVQKRHRIHAVRLRSVITTRLSEGCKVLTKQDVQKVG